MVAQKPIIAATSLAAALIALMVRIGIGPFQINIPISISAPCSTRFTNAEFEQLEVAMSLTDVQARLMTRGIELERTLTKSTYVFWANDKDGGYGIKATFEKNKLIEKQQVYVGLMGKC